MACDERFAIGSSSAGGAELHSRTLGELVVNLTTSAGYHWMALYLLKDGGPNGRRDRTRSVFYCPGTLHLVCAGLDGAVGDFNLIATDDFDPSPVVTYDHPPGSLCPGSAGARRDPGARALDRVSCPICGGHGQLLRICCEGCPPWPPRSR
jgi:hypothetical protein